MKHLTKVEQIADRKLLEELFGMADELRSKGPQDILKGKVLASIFYEPSTRTRLSFESAMLRMGGQVITSENAAADSSAKKGESLEDAIRVIGGYADAIVLRHPEKGAAERAAQGNTQHRPCSMSTLFKKSLERLTD
jgi:aspartate carbamoyltransferase catalytic subunit